MKRLFAFLLTMLLLCGLTLQASADTQTTEAPDETPTQLATEPSEEELDETASSPATEPSEEPESEDPTDSPVQPPAETAPPTTGPESCRHSWVYVEVDPTCTEYGARGYVCILCEALSEAEVIDLADHTYDHDCDPSCNVCGTERPVTHRFSSAWSRNSTQHWHACSICGEKGDAGGHYPGPAATEEKAQYCLTCGLMMMPRKAHTHKFSIVYSTDELEHWYACDGCEERKDVSPHRYDNSCDPDCNLCGYVSEKEHSYDSWKSDESGHWNSCSLCGFSTEPENHIPVLEVAENGPQICSICGFALASDPAHIHEPSNAWNSDEDSHWKLCECGEEMEKEFHRWDIDQENQEETMRHICTVCGLERTDTVPEADSGLSLPWWIPLILAVLICGALALVVLLVVGKKKGIF